MSQTAQIITTNTAADMISELENFLNEARNIAAIYDDQVAAGVIAGRMTGLSNRIFDLRKKGRLTQ